MNALGDTFGSDEDDPDDLVTLVSTQTEFEANTLVAVLRSAGIQAFAFGALSTLLPIGQRVMPAQVQVRKADVEVARAILKRNESDSVDLDWDEIDVGQREDNLPLKQHGSGMPLVVKFGFFLAILLVAGMIISGLIALVMMIVR
jgi:hypothetical protein